MARYDRIAMLPVPAATEAFHGWLPLRDLDGREREAELGRRLRLHFLVLRPLLRLVTHHGAVTDDSLAGQIARTREELGVLPIRDPQRSALAELLDAMPSGDAEALVAAALRMSQRALGWEHHAAAEAYADVALRLARREELGRLELAALTRLAQVALAAADADDAETHAVRAAALALQLGEREAWARATVELAGAAALRSGHAAALEVLADVRARAQEWRAPDTAVIGSLATCRHMLAMDNAAGAVQEAWRALRLAPRSAQRLALLGELIVALAALGMHEEAEHCSALVESRVTSTPERLLVRARRARLRAEAGDVEGFEKRAAVLSERPAALPAAARLELARGAFLAGNVAAARRHAAAVAQLARVQLLPTEAREAAELIAVLDRTAGRIVAMQRPARAPGPNIRRVAADIMTLGETLAPSVL